MTDKANGYIWKAKVLKYMGEQWVDADCYCKHISGELPEDAYARIHLLTNVGDATLHHIELHINHGGLLNDK